MAQEGRLFLDGRYRNAKLIGVFVRAGQWFGGDVAKNSLDFGIVDRHTVNPVEPIWTSLRRQQLSGAYAIAPDGSQQFKCFSTTGAKERAQPTTDVVIVGQQIFEVARYWRSGSFT
jgi:hypothetical protein